MIQINSRHNFLVGFLGAKPEEEISVARANEVNLWITLTMSLCCVLEIVIYFIYNRMVNNTIYFEIDIVYILDSSLAANDKWCSTRGRGN